MMAFTGWQYFEPKSNTNPGIQKEKQRALCYSPGKQKLGSIDI